MVFNLILFPFYLFKFLPMSEEITKAELLDRIQKLESIVEFYQQNAQRDAEALLKEAESENDVEKVISKLNFDWIKSVLEHDEYDDLIAKLCEELFTDLWSQISHLDFSNYREDNLDFSDIQAEVYLSCNILELNSIRTTLEDMGEDGVENIKASNSFEDIYEIDIDGNCTYKGNLKNELLEIVEDLDLINLINNGYAITEELFKRVINLSLGGNKLLQKKCHRQVDYQVEQVLEYASDSIGDTPLTLPRAIFGIANFIKDLYINDLQNSEIEFCEFEDYSIEVDCNELKYVSCLDVTGRHIQEQVNLLEDITFFEDCFTESIRILLSQLMPLQHQTISEE